MAKNVDELADFLLATQKDLPKNEFEVMWEDQDYEFCRIYNKDSMKVDGGKSISRRVMIGTTGQAKYREYYETDTPRTGDHLHEIEVKFTRLSTDYSWDELEILQNKNNAKKIIDLYKTKRIDALHDLANLIEERGWKTPTSATDLKYPYGIPYYINHITHDTTTEGFVGKTITYQDGTPGTNCAGIDAADEPKWRNQARFYTEINNDFLKTCRLAAMYIRFKAPLIVNDPSNKRTAQKRHYADYETVAKLMDLADARDDNHKGKDVLGNLTVKDGVLAMINRTPVVPVPQLEGYTDPEQGTATAPIYYVDFKYFIPIVHDGYWMKEKKPMTSTGQHTTYTVFIDGAHQNLCSNKRSVGYVIHKAI